MPDGGILSRVIHIFDREGDIAEVFALQGKNKNTGVVVRAAQNHWDTSFVARLVGIRNLVPRLVAT